MLSILIPVYNFDVRELVYELVKQSENEKNIFEIILIDDKSNNDYKLINRELSENKNVIYIELEKNIGRSKIRNLLAEKAKFNYLIFMDCDSEVVDEKYIKNYIPFCENEILVYGGRVYKNNAPSDNKLYLRWLYGIKREVVASNTRALNPNKSFMTNNFLISKKLFNKIKFDEKITTYGHEDTIFGYELKKRNIKIIHIDNPLIHIGLEDNEHFLRKTKQGIENLKYLSKKFENEDNFFDDIKILKYYKIIKKLRLSFIINIFKTKIIKNLKSNNPNLQLFDLYKLVLMLS